MNKLFLFGLVKRITVTESKNPAKGPSAIIFVQYGPSRKQSSGPVEFVNAVQVRIPNFRYAQIKDQLVNDCVVDISGHVQGVLKPNLEGNNTMTVEPVADLISIKDMSWLQAALKTETPPTSDSSDTSDA